MQYTVLTCALIAAALTATFAVLYGIKLGELSDMECIAIRGSDAEGLPEETVDVIEKWGMSLRFGLGMWIANTVVALLVGVSAFNYKMAALTAIIASCGLGWPNLIQLGYLGVYRWTWYGDVCSEKYEDMGDFMKRVFITQAVFQFLMGSVTSVIAQCVRTIGKAAA